VAHLLRWAPLLLTTLITACGGKAFEMDGSDTGGQGGAGSTTAGGSHAGGSSAGASAKGGGSVGGGSVGGSSVGGGSVGGSSVGGSAGAGSVCEGFADDAGTFIMVNIINKTDVPLYLGQERVSCEEAPLFGVEDQSGTALEPPSRCRAACGADFGGCTAICLQPSAILLAPGDMMQTSYDGLFDVSVTLPKQCAAQNGGSLTCDQARQIQPGEYTFMARAGSSIDCSQTSADVTCSACVAQGSGGCKTPGALITGELHTAKTVVTLDGSYGVYPTATTDPGPTPGGSGAAPARRAVELVFTE
jgi:hypothetical protein